MELPLFPLPGLVVFPDISFPLHIFEDRYKLLINRCIDRGETFGLVLLREGAEEETEQTIHRVGTTARVTEVERIEGGRLNIYCRSESRFHVLRFLDRTPFWVAETDYVEDENEDPSKLAVLAEEVAALYTRAYQLAVKLEIVAAAELRLPAVAQELSFMISYFLDIGAEEKQKLLEMRSTEQRLRLLMDLVDRTIQRLESRAARTQVVRKAQGNGDLGMPGAPH